MKKLTIFCLMIAALSCQNAIEPNSISSFEYSEYWGFTGRVVTLYTTPESQIFKPYSNSDKICKTAISAKEWRQITALFDYETYNKLPRKAELGCCDRSSSSLKMNVNGKIYVREWEVPLANFTDSTGINRLLNILNKKIAEQSQMCR